MICIIRLDPHIFLTLSFLYRSRPGVHTVKPKIKYCATTVKEFKEFQDDPIYIGKIMGSQDLQDTSQTLIDACLLPLLKVMSS